MAKTLVIIFFFITTMIAVAFNFYWFSKWLDERGSEAVCPSKIELIVEEKKCKEVEACPDVDIDLYNDCLDLPIFQPAEEEPDGTFIYNEEFDIYVYDLPIPEIEPVVNVPQETIPQEERVCIDPTFFYYETGDPKYCLEWNYPL